MNNRVHVGNLADDTTAATLIEAFRSAGYAGVRVQLVMTRDFGRSRGFAFVELATEQDALAAVNAVNGSTIDGRVVRVDIAHAPKSRFGGRIATRVAPNSLS